MGFNSMLYPGLLIGLAVYPTITTADRLKIQGIDGGDKVVVMGDARKNSRANGCVNDQVFRSTGESTMPHANLLPPAGCNSEIAIFSANNAMLLDTPVITWTNAATDVHTATLAPIIKVAVSVWIVDPAATPRAVVDMNRAILLYKQNKVGVEFVPTFAPVTGAAVATINDSVTAADGDIQCKDIPGVQTSGFYTAGTLNVYYVALGVTGRNCAIAETPPSCPVNAGTFPPGDGNITYIGTTANRASLAHEFGHAFGLRPGPPSTCGGHTNDLPGFGPKNIMWAGGDGNRNRFTLGQVFRMNTHADQWGGTMLIKNGLRPGPGRACPPLMSSATCPALKKDWPRP